MSAAVQPLPCPNCAHPAPQPVFCPRCGQRTPHHHEYALSHFFHELFHELLHVDGKIFRTLSTLFFRPGQLTLEYWNGRRARFLPPLRIYLIATAIFFAFSSATGNILNDPQFTQVPELKQIIAKITPARFEARFQIVYKLLLSFSVAGFALFLRLILGNARPYGAYLIASLHTIAFLFFFSTALQPLDLRLSAALGLPQGTFSLPVLALIYWPYLAFSLRRWTHLPWTPVLLRLLALILLTLALDGFVAFLSFAITTLSLLLSS